MNRSRVPPRTVTSRDELFWNREWGLVTREMNLDLQQMRIDEYEAEKREQAAIGTIVPAGRRKD